MKIGLQSFASRHLYVAGYVFQPFISKSTQQGFGSTLRWSHIFPGSYSATAITNWATRLTWVQLSSVRSFSPSALAIYFYSRIFNFRVFHCRVFHSRIQRPQWNWNETVSNSFETVLKLFCFSFISLCVKILFNAFLHVLSVAVLSVFCRNYWRTQRGWLGRF